MVGDDGRRGRDVAVLSAVAAGAWWLLLTRDGHAAHGHHGAAAAGLWAQAGSWLVMLAAMMAPGLAEPIRHIRRRSFAHRRGRSIALFVAGYLAVWMAAGVLLTGAAQGLDAWAGAPIGAAIAVGVVAWGWQCTPLKQRCLNRCHAMATIPAFGTDADKGAVRFGVSHGAWCVGTCWGLMLWPMTLPAGQAAAMAVVTALIVSERLDCPAPARWRFRGLGPGPRLLVAQARLRLVEPWAVH
jgi:predicted metal-binding membrane protein